MRKAFILIVGLAFFLWTTDAWPQTQSTTQSQTQTQTQQQTTNAQGKAAKNGKPRGTCDGTGNQGVGPRDGTGYGTQSGQKMGPRDGTGRATNPGTGAGGGQGRRGGKR